MTTSTVSSVTDELLAELGNTLTAYFELNTSNYGHDDVCQMNSWSISACEAMERADLHIRSLAERLEKAEKDAERYQWLRQGSVLAVYVETDGSVMLESRTAKCADFTQKLDYAIDAAIAQQPAE